MKISIVIPAYNEQDTIANVVVGCFSKFPNAEVIVVDDASTDRTPQILKKLKKQHKGLIIYTQYENYGHATAVIDGLREAKGDYIIYMDADNQIKLDDFPLAFKRYSLVSGYRVNRQDKLFRKVVSFILKVTILLRHGLWIKDANCPFKIFNREILKLLMYDLPKNSIVPSICLEILARRYAQPVLEIPVKHYPYIKERKGSLQSINKNSLTMFWKAFKEVWKI